MNLPKVDIDHYVMSLPCPKCGEPRTNLEYHAGNYVYTAGALCRPGDPEHFHRTCTRCRYVWRTDDVLTKEGKTP